MTAGRWQRIKEVIEAVEGLSGEPRRTALDDLCAGDPALRDEVESLLAGEERIAILEPPKRSALGGELRQAGPYRIERLIGAGGMGAVYLASRADREYDKRVAVKVIQAIGGPDVERRFRRERQILASLEHPGIARLIDGGTLENGLPYLVMEYVEGQRIDEFCESRKRSTEQRLRLFLKVCDAVQYAHRNLVVHRDLKPGNILVTDAGEPRLLDFGIAKILHDGASEEESTRPLERMLTPSAASPEQVAGRAVTTASDVYSLGVLLYRLLTGVSPYQGAPGFPADTANAILHYDPPAASSVTSSGEGRLRGDLDTILAKAMEKDPARRYGSVEEFAGDIERHLEGLPVRARKASAGYRLRKFAGRHRMGVAAGVVLAMAIAGGMAGSLWYARRAQAEKARADRRFTALRKISESLLFELHDSIRDLPGSTAARALVTRRALEYLDQLAAEDGQDAAVQRDLASAYVRVGNILAGERGPHLGGREAAKNALAGYQKALDIRRRLAAASPGDAALRQELMEALWAVAGARQGQGQVPEALALQQERLRLIAAVPEKQRPLDLRYSEATTYAALAELRRMSGDNTAAIESARQSLALRQALLDADPGSARARRVVGLSHEGLGYALASVDRYAESAEEHRKATAEFERLLAKDQRNADHRRNLEIAEMNLCESLAHAGSGEAVGHCRRALELAGAARGADAKDAQAREDVAAAWATLGFALRLRGEWRPALESQRRAEAAYRLSEEQDPDSRGAALGHADVLVELARVEAKLGEPGACSHFAQGKAVMARLLAAAPADRLVKQHVADAAAVGICRQLVDFPASPPQ